MRRSVRGGFVARGVTYGVIGALALALALRTGGGSTTTQQGALAALGALPLGRAALALGAAGLLAYALWKLLQGIAGRGPEGGGGTARTDRLSNLAAGVAYLVFFVVALRVTISGGAGSSSQQHTARGVLGWPAGPELIGAGGVAMIAVSAYQIYDALSGHFLEQFKVHDIPPRARGAVTWVGRVGLTARALVFVLVGWFLVRAAIDFDPAKAVGVDGALRAVQRQTYGQVLLGLVALGLLVFALYSFVEARYRRL